MNNSRKKNIFLVLAIVLIAVLLLIYGLTTRKASPTVKDGAAASDEVLTAAETPDVDSSDEASAEVDADIAAAADAYLERNPAESYVVVSTSSAMYLPVPLVEGNSFKLNFSDTEYNLVHVGDNSVYMEESTCDNQNCVGQGEITLENRNDRILYNMILCLPHDLSLELLDVDETREYLVEFYTAKAAYETAMEQSEG